MKKQKPSLKVLRHLAQESLAILNQPHMNPVIMLQDQRYYQQRACELVQQNLLTPSPNNLKMAIGLLILSRVNDSIENKNKPKYTDFEQHIIKRVQKCNGKRRKHDWVRSESLLGDECKDCTMFIDDDGRITINGSQIGAMPQAYVDWCPVNKKHVRGSDGKCDYCRTMLDSDQGTGQVDPHYK